MELYTTYNDFEVWFTEFVEEKGTKFCKARANIRDGYDICPFCAKLVKEGPVMLLINNHKLFPNVIVHGDCCANFETKEDAMKYLHEDYQEALKHKHWFSNI